MVNTHDLATEVVELHLVQAMQAVFRPIIRQPAILVPHQSDPSLYTVALDETHVVGAVGLVGAINGLVYLYFTLPFARLCASHLLKKSAPTIEQAGDEVVNDVVGELTNMTVGTFKNQFAEGEGECWLTIPSILRGREFTINTIKSATRHIYRFDLGGHRVTADLLLVPGN